MAGLQYYVIDSSSFIHMNFDYSMRVFKSVWEKCDALINEGRLRAPATVLEELKRKDDELSHWAKKRQKKLFRNESDLDGQYVKDVISSCQGLVDENRLYEQADPYVVAMALEERAKPSLLDREICVISEEYMPVPDARRKIRKIPEVCKHFGLCCMRVALMMEREGWEI